MGTTLPRLPPPGHNTPVNARSRHPHLARLLAFVVFAALISVAWIARRLDIARGQEVPSFSQKVLSECAGLSLLPGTRVPTPYRTRQDVSCQYVQDLRPSLLCEAIQTDLYKAQSLLSSRTRRSGQGAMLDGKLSRGAPYSSIKASSSMLVRRLRLSSLRHMGRMCCV